MYKKLIVISEESHGTIAVATSFAAAKRYIIDAGWLTEMDEVYHNHELVNVKKLFGDNWKEQVMAQDQSWFDGMFYFYEIDFAE